MKSFLSGLGICLILFAVSCTNRNHVSVSDSNLGDTVDVLQNLVFDFSHDLAPDSVFGKWDSSAYMSIQPEVKGMFKWNSARQLVFSPAAGFKPATSYKVHLSTALLKFTRGQLSLDATTLSFQTPDLAIGAVQTWWTLSNTSNELLTFHASINFNYDVDPSVLAAAITGEVNGKTVQFTVPEQNVSTNIQVQAEGLNRSDAGKGKYSINIAKGLKCTECNNGAPALKFESELYPITNLEITGTETDFENGEGIIRIFTNQPVLMADIEKLIKIEPTIVYRVETLESGILLRGGFTAGSAYELAISNKIQGLLGGSLENDYFATVNFGEQEPGITFVHSKGMYLTSKGSRKVALQIVNMPKVKVSVHKIYENNILAFMQNNRYNDWYEDEESSVFSYNDYDLDRFGNRILDQEYSSKDLPKQNGMSLLSLDFQDDVPFRGIYLITARSSENQWIKASKMVSVSDIGLIARSGENEVYVFANSVKEATPMQKVTINIISSNNQVLFTGTTNGDGVVNFKGLKDKYSAFRPALITARSGNDFNYMLLSDTRVETSRFETGGYRDNSTGYMALIYGDRELYRPGETIHTNIIARTRNWKPLKAVPVKIRLLQPNGRELSVQRKTLNAQGASAQDFILPAGTATGTYTLELYTANDVLLNSKNISVEEFMPDRIAVKVSSNKTDFILGDSVQLKGSAANLFGTPAVNRKYEVQFNLNKVAFQPKGYESFNFYIRGIDNVGFPSVFKEGTTSANGEFAASMYLDPLYRETGKLQGSGYVTVFDETGRPVNRSVVFNVETQKYYYGLKTSEYYAGVGQSMQLGMISLNSAGQPAPSTARLQIIKVNYQNILSRSYGDRLHYISQRQEKILQDRQVNLGNKELVTPFTPTESGEYLVRLSLPGSDRYVEEQFYAYGWGYTGSTAFAVNTEGTIDITTDKTSYQPGEKAKVLFKTPFNGRLLITVEQQEVIRYYTLNTDKKAAELQLPIDGKFLPNIYITATLFRKIDDGSIPLTVAHGVAPVMVEEKNNQLPLTIVAAEKSRANTKQQITVKTKPSSDIEVTIAVVDEGILQIRNTETPDPYKFFYQKKALMVDGYDLYPYLLPELKMRRSSTGGDGYDLAKRVNPITNKRVKLITAWSGQLHTNAQGIATYQMDIPSFSGDLRVMAVAYKDGAFGSAEAHMKVADPVVISSALPRFTSPGDTISVPVTFTNTTNKRIDASIKASATGAIKITNNAGERIQLNPGQEQRMVYKIAAPSGTGEGSFSVQVINGKETYSEKTALTVRPPASLQVRNGSGAIKGGQSGAVDFNFGFIPSTAEAELMVSRSPLVSFADQLSYLLDYPHGCAEQTISIAFPQIYYGDLVKSLTNKPGYVVQTKTNVQAAITKIQSMQHYSGGIVTWPGQSTTNTWTSAYAAHFLTEASKAGFEVNESSKEKLLNYLRNESRKKNTEDYWYWASDKTYTNKKIPAKDIFYSLYVLAINNKADRSTMNYYRSRFNDLCLDSKYLLATTYLAIGDRRTYDDLLPKAFEGEKSGNATGGSFYSYVRDLSMALNALLSHDPDNMQVGIMVRQLSTEISKRNWMSTQERAISFLALGKFSRLTQQSTVTATLTTSGGKSFNFDGKDLTIRKELVNTKVNFTTKGSGQLYYFWKSEGLTTDGNFKPEDANIRVRKTFFNRNGSEIQGNVFKQNDLIVVRISLENLTRSFIENIVVTDMLPAGFEIENPRISSIPDLDWIKNNSGTEHIDMRDDRIHLYTSLSAQPQYYYYVVRAVSPGNYVMGPVSADAMYSGEYHSINGAGRILVKE